MKAIKYFTCIVLLALTSRIYSQVPDTIWTKTFGGPLADVGNSVKQTNDGGFIVASTTSSFGAGGQDIWLIKTDENGDTLWTKTFGGAGNDRASNVVQTNDNGYAIFGTTNSYGNGGDDFLLWKTDSFGNTEWFKTYGTSLNEVASEGKQMTEGGYLITGYFYDQRYKSIVLKLNNQGEIIWEKLLVMPGSADLWANSVEQATNNNYFIGCTWGHDYFGGYAYEWYMFQLSEDGDSLFSTYYFNVGADFLDAIRNTTEGNLILGGSTAYEYIWLRKRNPNGGTIWSRIISVSVADVSLSDIEPTPDNGYIISAIIQVSNNNPLRDIVLLKTDADGFVEWEKRIIGNGIEDALSVSPTNDDGFVLSCKTNSLGAGDFDIWLLKFKYNPPPINVQIDFFPPVDTALVQGGCTTPEFRCKNLVGVNGRDSISIEPGFNTYFYYYDSTGTQIPLDNYYFLVIDSLNEFDYELWYYPKSFPPYEPVLIQFDSTFYSEQKKFDIQLVVKKDGIRIHSLSQPFHADFGLSVDDSGIIPNEFNLSQNYPNPFNPLTKIKYKIPSVTLRQAQSDNWVTLKVYDVLGNEIATLVDDEKQPGTYEVEFNSSSIKHLPSSGIYFYQLKAGDYTQTRKMILLK